MYHLFSKETRKEPNSYDLKFWYSGGRMRFYGKNVSFCVSTTTESMKTNNIPLKSPIKLPPEMQKKFEFFKICWFLGPFSKNQ